MRVAVLVAALVPLLAMGFEVRGQTATVILAADAGTHLQPIAQLGRAGWVAVPASGLGRLAPAEWTRWTADGQGRSIRLGLREPTGRCAAPGRLPIAHPPASGPGANAIGLASSAPLEVEPVRRLPDGSPEWTQIAEAAGSLFDRRAREHGVSPAAFAQVPVTLDHAYEGGRRRDARAYYFEASKRLFDSGDTPDEDPKGVVRVTVSGWFRESEGRLVPAGTKGELHWDPVDDVVQVPGTALAPIGVVRHGSEQVWVMDGHTGVRHAFSAYVLGTTVRPLLSVDAAAC